jgi:hypothetical protein
MEIVTPLLSNNKNGRRVLGFTIRVWNSKALVFHTLRFYSIILLGYIYSSDFPLVQNLTYTTDDRE